jgi:hypothetical protein
MVVLFSLFYMNTYTSKGVGGEKKVPRAGGGNKVE